MTTWPGRIVGVIRWNVGTLAQLCTFVPVFCLDQTFSLSSPLRKIVTEGMSVEDKRRLRHSYEVGVPLA